MLTAVWVVVTSVWVVVTLGTVCEWNGGVWVGVGGFLCTADPMKSGHTDERECRQDVWLYSVTAIANNGRIFPFGGGDGNGPRGLGAASSLFRAGRTARRARFVRIVIPSESVSASQLRLHNHFHLHRLHDLSPSPSPYCRLIGPKAEQLSFDRLIDALESSLILIDPPPYAT